MTHEMYKEEPSAKLETMVDIVKHHLAADGAPGLVPRLAIPLPESALRPPQHRPEQPEQPQEQPDPEQQKQRQQRLEKHRKRQDQKQVDASGKPDKIIIYAYFPSSFWLLKLASKHRLRQRCAE